jgi:hypothetical protein
MKRTASTIAVLTSFAIAGAAAFAAEKDAPPPKPPQEGAMGMGGMGGEGHGGMGMMGGGHGGMGMMSDEQMDTHLRAMQDFMLKNHEFMHQIRDAKDDKEKARLKDEWLASMKNHMKAHQMPPQMKMHGMPEHGAPAK